MLDEDFCYRPERENTCTQTNTHNTSGLWQHPTIWTIKNIPNRSRLTPNDSSYSYMHINLILIIQKIIYHFFENVRCPQQRLIISHYFRTWTTPQSDNRALLSLDNSGRSWTVSAPDKVTAVPVRRNGNFQTPISVPVVRPKWCHTLSNPANRQDYTVACLNYTLQMMMPLPGWPVMAPNAYNNNNFKT